MNLEGAVRRIEQSWNMRKRTGLLGKRLRFRPAVEEDLRRGIDDH